MPLHLDILNPVRQRVFQSLKIFHSFGLLGGGTSLALQIGHRNSYDFDIFSAREIPRSLIPKCRKELSIRDVLVNSVDEFTFITQDSVKVTFLYYPFSFHGRPLPSPSISLLGMMDIIGSKAYALNQRGTFRDYIDLYWVMKFHKVSLEQIIARAKAIHKEVFSPKLFLGQLVYMDDLTRDDIQSVSFLQKPVSKAVVQSFFEEKVDQFQKKHILPG